MAHVYFIEEHRALTVFADHQYIFCDGNLLRKINNGSYFEVNLPVGYHSLAVGDFGAGLPAKLLSQRTYYFFLNSRNPDYVKAASMWHLEPMPDNKALAKMGEMHQLDSPHYPLPAIH